MPQFISGIIKTHIPVSAILLQEAILRYQGKQLLITYEEYNPKKLGQKRRQYFSGIVQPIARELGYSRREAHNALKRACNSITVTDILTGEQVVEGGTTRIFKTIDDWEIYMDKCRKLAKRIGIKLLTTDEYFESIATPENNQSPFGGKP